MSVAWVGAGIALVGAVSSADASRSAANKQADAAQQASDTQTAQYDQTRQDNLPTIERGNRAGDMLQYYMGLTPNSNFKSKEQLRAELTPQFTHGATTFVPTTPNAATSFSRTAYTGATGTGGYGAPAAAPVVYQPASGPNNVDDTALNAAVDKAYSGQKVDPNYGSLLRRFSLADLSADPVYTTGLNFGLSEGTKALSSMAAANGSLQSGATLKALTRYANDYGTTKAEGSYNRYNNDNSNIYNRLAGIAGTGQQANQFVGSAGANAATQIGQNQIYAGNARAASAIDQNNAWQGAADSIYGVVKKNYGTPTPTPTPTSAPDNSRHGYI